MPSAPWLLVCPLLALKEQMQKGARRSERPDETTIPIFGVAPFFLSLSARIWDRFRSTPSRNLQAVLDAYWRPVLKSRKRACG